MNKRIVGWSALAAAGLAGAAGPAWIASLPPAPTTWNPPPVGKDESDAALAALKPPKRLRPVVAIVGINDATETTDYVVASGRGTVFSYVVHHAPKVPGRSLPFVVALVELEEGSGGERSDEGSIRMLGELRGVDPADVHIGMPVEVTYLDFPGDDETGGAPWTLYAWTPRQETA